MVLFLKFLGFFPCPCCSYHRIKSDQTLPGQSVPLGYEIEWPPRVKGLDSSGEGAISPCPASSRWQAVCEQSFSSRWAFFCRHRNGGRIAGAYVISRYTVCARKLRSHVACDIWGATVEPSLSEFVHALAIRTNCYILAPLPRLRNEESSTIHHRRQLARVHFVVPGVAGFQCRVAILLRRKRKHRKL